MGYGSPKRQTMQRKLNTTNNAPPPSLPRSNTADVSHNTEKPPDKVKKSKTVARSIAKDGSTPPDGERLTLVQRVKAGETIPPKKKHKHRKKKRDSAQGSDKDKPSASGSTRTVLSDANQSRRMANGDGVEVDPIVSKKQESSKRMSPQSSQRSVQGGSPKQTTRIDVKAAKIELEDINSSESEGESEDGVPPGMAVADDEKAREIDEAFAAHGEKHIYLTSPEARAESERLMMTNQELRKLRHAFNSIDIDGSQSIDYLEFLEAIEEEKTPFVTALFNMIDIDPNGSITFDDFFRITATYCMFNKQEILKFAFRIFDSNGNDTIDEQEFKELCHVVNNNNPVFPGNFERVVTEFDRNRDGLIDFNEFAQLNTRYPLILFPAFRIHDRMQRFTLGDGGWAVVVKRKNLLEKNRSIMGGDPNYRAPPPPGCVRALCGLVFPSLFPPSIGAAGVAANS